MNLDQLMKSIRTEAKQLYSEKVSTASKPTESVFDLNDLVDKISFSAFPDLSPKNYYTVSELVRYDDAQFIKNVFIALLQRQPDDHGFSSYLGALRSGESKLNIIYSIYTSHECQESGVRLRKFKALKFLLGFEGRWPNKLFKNQILEILISFFGFKKSEEFEFLSDRLFKIESIADTLRFSLNKVGSKFNDLIDENAQLKHLIQSLESARDQDRLIASNLQHRLSYDTQLLALCKESKQQSEALPTIDTSSADVDAFYVAFEDACRGTREEINEKLSKWLDFIPAAEKCSGRALDIGCGRGEWLSILENSGYTAFGIDINPIMVKSCQELGLDAQQVDVLSWLSAQDSDSVSVITAFHVVEHIPFEQLLRWTVEAYRVLEPGGVLIFETPNPENPLVGSHTFYHDPTHRNPITPTLLTFLGNYSGFEAVSIERLHPYPEEARVNGIDPLSDRINGLLCGPQDFALVAKKQGDVS